MTERAERLSSTVRSIAGMIEVVLQQPIVGRSTQWSAPALYRGVRVSLPSVAPVTAHQLIVSPDCCIDRRHQEQRPQAN
ncbi:unnamed protein product [Peronospora destructor]|uniref:Uncharacterized protein n=1 Tax=Peronospora destructor TaxID=86335 RepID=A0AAV0UF47_9STRA|nr:unnamed protein product [Peronospora destructor]